MRSLVDLVLSPRVLRPLFWLLAAFSLTMALLPRPPRLAIDRFGDKFEHILAFAVLTVVAELAWRGRPVWKTVAALLLFGAAIEVLQAIPVLHRDSDVRDWLADGAAVLAASLLVRPLVRRLARS